MKKIIELLLVGFIISGASLSVVSCNIGDITTRNYIEGLPEFNWSTGETEDGDGYNWFYDQFDKNGIDFNGSFFKKTDSSNGVVDKIFDYDNYATSYKGANFIKKQGSTGSPIIKSYRPNGNKWLDFGIQSRSRKFNYINSLPTWNDGKDMDLKYNISKEKLRGRNYVAKSTVKNQQKSSFFNMFHAPSSSSSSILGTKNPFGGNLTNLSYMHQMYTWPAITNKGWLTPSFADYSEYMHKNGVPVLGLWYMSGWEDLTRESLKSILEIDSNGNYKMVDILIQQCIKFNFDGWIINNEANGSQGDGYVIKNSEINKIMEQFNREAKKIQDKIGRKLAIVYYTNDGSLEYDKVSARPNSKKTVDASRSASAIQLDFGISTPNLNQYISSEHNGNNEARKNAYTLLNESITIPSVGAYDYRNQIFNKNNLNEYDNEPNNSFSIFGSGGANEYSKSFKNFLKAKNIWKEKDLYKYLIMQQELSNLYSTYQMTGKNGYLENDAEGYDMMIGQGQQNIEAIYMSDPRIKFDSFNSEDKNWNEAYKNNFVLNNNGKYNKSYGIGNSFLEKTIVADRIIDNNYSEFSNKEPEEIENDPSMKTYFSTGSGIYFINRDSKGEIIYDKINPWTNSRIADSNPTYQWDFWSSIRNSNTNSIKTNDGEKFVSQINNDGQLAPYYDYYNPYMKGNSISIGMGYDFNNDGKVIPGIWSNNDYFWNLMGTNLSKNNYKVSFYIKASDENKLGKSSKSQLEHILDNTQITYTDSKLSEGPKTIDTIIEEKNKDGWYKISADLSSSQGINKDNRIAKLGLKINPQNNNNFIFSVGGFEINKHKVDSNQETIVSKINSEYIVKRKTNDNNINIRFNWETNNSSASYFQIYYSTDGRKWYYQGQNNLNSHYIRELNESSENYIYLGVQPIYNDGIVGDIFYSKISTKYNY